MNPKTHKFFPLAAIAGLALTASAAAITEVITNFYTSTSASKGTLTTGGLYSPLQLGASTASPFTYEYDISGLGLGAANKLKITVATTGANLNNGGNNGIAVVGGSNTSWWDITHFPALRSGPTAVSGATRQKQIPSSQPVIPVIQVI